MSGAEALALGLMDGTDGGGSEGSGTNAPDDAKHTRVAAGLAAASEGGGGGRCRQAFRVLRGMLQGWLRMQQSQKSDFTA